MKKLVKILAWVAGIFVLLVIVAVIGLKLFFPAEKVRALAIEKAGSALGRDVSIAEIDISLWGGLGVRLVDVAVSNPEWMERGDCFSARDIDVKLQILPLLSGEYRVDRLIVNEPEISMLKLADGTNNFTLAALDKKLPPGVAGDISPETKTAVAAVTFDRLEINNGHLDYVDDSAGMEIHLRNFDLSTTLESPRKDFYESSGRIVIESLVVAIDEPWPAFSVALDYKGEYDVAARRLALDEADLEINGLLFELRGEMQHPSGSVQGRGSIKSRRISVADLFKLLPEEQLALLSDFSVEGDFSLDIDLEYDSGREDPLLYGGTAIITELSMSRSDIPGELKFKQALVDFEPDNLRMNIKEGTFDGEPFKGHLVVNDFADPKVNGELAGKLNLAFVQPFLPAGQKHEIAGETDFTTKFSGPVSDPKKMQFSGEIVVTKGRYNSEALPEPVESFTLDVYFDNSLTRVNNFEARMPSGQLTFSGRIKNLIPYMMADSVEAHKVTPSVDGVLRGQLNLAMLTPFLPPKGNPQITGQISVDLNLVGKATDISNFKPRGKLSITNASYRDSLLPEPIEHFEAEMLVSPDTLAITNLRVKFVSSDLSLSGKLIDPFPYLLPLEIIDKSRVKKPFFSFELSSHRFDTDRLFPEAVPGSGTNRASLPADSAPPLILPDIDGRGTLKIDTLVYSRVEFTSVVGKIKVHDRKIDCYDLTADVYSGHVAGKNSIDLNDFENPRYVGEFQATQVEADDFVSRFTEFGGHLFGKINLNGSYDARGWEPDVFLNSLSMNGTLAMREGKIMTSGQLFSAINSLADKAGTSFEREQSLKNLNSNILVKDGKVRLDRLKASLGDMGDVDLDGYYGFDGGINYNGTILLSKSWTQKLLSQGGLIGGLSGFLSDKSVDRIKLPLVVSGTIDKPKMDVDYSALSKEVGDNLMDNAGDLLKGLFKKKKK